MLIGDIVHAALDCGVALVSRKRVFLAGLPSPPELPTGFESVDAHYECAALPSALRKLAVIVWLTFLFLFSCG